MYTPRFLIVWLLAGLASLLGLPAPAQVSPDQTLGSEVSVITPQVEVRGALAERIEGGAVRGANLFHSFSDFGVLESQRVYFANPAGIESILSRVTGDRASNIFGTLGVDGPADLFLINPNGIVFGTNAALDIAGSFHATTADALSLGEGTFSATDPATSQLLTVKPSTSFFNYLSVAGSGNIVSRGQLAAGGTLSLVANRLDLQGTATAGNALILGSANTVRIGDMSNTPFVALAPAGTYIQALGDVEVGTYEGNSLHILAGGGVTLDTATVTATDSDTSSTDFIADPVRLSDGTVVNIQSNAEPTLDIRAGVRPEAITGAITNTAPMSADISVGDILITGLNGLVLLSNQYESNSQLPAGNILVESKLASVIGGGGIFTGSGGGGGGQIFLDAKNDISVIDSAISTLSITESGKNIVLLAGEDIQFSSPLGRVTGVIIGTPTDGQTKGGNIRIAADNLLLSGGAQLNTSTLGATDAGDVIISVRDRAAFQGFNPLTGVLSGIRSSVNPGATGSGGNILISANSLEMANIALLSTGSSGDRRADGSPSNAGNITINAVDSVTLSNLAQLRSDTSTQGSAGDISVTAGGQVSIDGIALVNNIPTPTGITSSVTATGVPIGPDDSNTSGVRAGQITITADSLALTNGGAIASDISGIGNAGNIVIHTTGDIQLSGSRDFLTSDSSGNTMPFTRASIIASGISQGSIGQGGDIAIEGNSLTLDNGAQLTSTTFGRQGTDGVVSSAGGVSVNVMDSVALNRGSQIRSDTSGQGNAGNVSVTAGGAVVFDGVELINGLITPSGIGSSVRADIPNSLTVGDAGQITVDANSFALTNGAVIESATAGQGNAGSVKIVTDGAVQIGGSRTLTAPNNSGVLVPVTRTSTISTTVGASGIGQGGDLNITSGALTMDSGAQLQTGTTGQKDSEGNSSNAGDITIYVAGDIAIQTSSQLRSDTSGQGDAGDITLNATGDINIDGVGIINGQLITSGVSSSVVALDPNTGTLGAGDAGTITIEGNSVALTNGAVISSETGGQGSAGNIAIKADEAVRLAGSGTVVFSDANGNSVPITRRSIVSSSVNSGAIGQGGDINIRSNELVLADGTQLLTRTFGQRDREGNPSHAGNITVNTNDSVIINGGSQLRSDTAGQGNAGNVTLTAAGALTIEGAEILGGVLVPSGIASSVTSEAQPQVLVGEGNAGQININARTVALTSGGGIESATVGRGNAGSVKIVADEDVELSGTRTFELPDANGNVLRGVRTSVISTAIFPGAVGQGGGIDINSDSLTLSDGAQLTTSTSGLKGPNGQLSSAGNIAVDVDDTLSLASGATIDSRTFGEGNAGNISLMAGGAVTLNGVSVINGVPIQTSILSQVANSPDPDGDAVRGGDITVRADSLSLTEGAGISANTFGRGNSGNILIDIEKELSFSGITPVTIDGAVFGYTSGISSQVGFGAIGNASSIQIEAESVEMDDNAYVETATLGNGDAGSITLEIEDYVNLAGNSFMNSGVRLRGKGKAGGISLTTGNLTLVGGSQISSSVLRGFAEVPGGQGAGGDVEITASEAIRIIGVSSRPFNFANIINPRETVSLAGYSSGIFASAEKGTVGPGGTITIRTGDLQISDGGVINAITSNASSGGNVDISARTLAATSGGQITATARDQGQAGSITLNIQERALFTGTDPTFERRLAEFGEDVVNNQGGASGVFANTTPGSSGGGQNILINAGSVSVKDGAVLTSRSEGSGVSGNLSLNVRERLALRNGEISTSSEATRGGDISINAGSVVLREDSDIKTNVNTDEGGGGNITIAANAVVALEDSDILAFSTDGRGGAINLSQTTLFSNPLDPISRSLTPAALDGNNRVDINATGGTEEGIISTRNDSLAENNLAALPDNLINTENLVANSCILRNDDDDGAFILTGRDRLPQTPNETPSTVYPAGTVQSIPTTPETASITEPQAIYQLAGGRLLMSRDCQP